MNIKKFKIAEKLKFLTSLFLVAYILNLVWENLQKPLFIGFEVFWKSGITCYSAAFGDTLMIIGIYFLVAIIRRKYYWFSIRTKEEILLLIVFGFVMAVLVEKYALATHRWGYTPLMPIIPLLGVGLVPVLQMLILPFITLQITQKIIQ